MDSEPTEKDCKENCEIDIYGKLREDIYKVLCPEAQASPHNWTYATNRKRLDEIMVVVRAFILERLADDVRYKEIMRE